MTWLNLDELEAEAIARLPPMVADYYAGGSRSERALRANRAAMERYALRPRVLAGVEGASPATHVLGAPAACPLVIAPTAMQRMAHPDGELATARAARRAGLPMTLSTLSNTPVEEVVAAGGTVWFQLYAYRDRDATWALVERVRQAGAQALVLTVDAARLGTRERDVRNGFHLPPGLGFPNAMAEGRGGLPAVDGGSALARYVAEALEPGLGWADLERIVERAGVPVLVKGVLRGDDAARALERGAAGIWVSNHGGRQLDGAITGLEALPEVVAAARTVPGAPVIVDGGFRRGTDLLVALALGATAVAVGRPVLWGLATGGEEGVARVLATLRDELEEAMALAGAPTIADLGPDLVHVR